MQVAAHFVEASTAGGDLGRLLAQGADQAKQVAAQAIERAFDIGDLADLRLDPCIAGEVSLGPFRKCRHQLTESSGQLALQTIDGQGDQQDQQDDAALQHAHLRLDTAMLGAYRRLQLGQGLLHGIDLAGAVLQQLAALADQLPGALQLGRIALDQAGQLALERNALVFTGLLRGIAEVEQGGEIARGRLLGCEHAE